MIPTQVRNIWLGALALLALWSLLAWQSLARLDEFQTVRATRLRTERASFYLQEVQGALWQMESGNRLFLLSADQEARDEPFLSGRDLLSKRYKALENFYADDRGAQAKLKEFKGPLNRWFALSNAAIDARRAAGPDATNSLLRRLARGEVERTRTLGEARNILRGLSNTLIARGKVLTVESNAKLEQVRSMTLATIGLGVFGIAGLGLMLARQAYMIGVSNEAVRREVESRRRAEREREILSNHDEQILNSTTEGIVGLNAKGRITFVNPAAAMMLGWEASELLGKSWHDLAQHSRGDNTRLDKDASPVMATLRDATQRRISDDVFWKRTGRTFPVEYAVSLLYELSPRENEEKQLSGATLTFRDITERKRSEIALLRLASVVESSKDAILSHLLDGTIVSCNASAVKMYGYSAREMEGKPLSVLFPPSRAQEATLIVEHMARGERIEPYQTTLLAKGDERIDVAITFYPVRDARGNIMGASSNARPVRREAMGNLPTFEAMRVTKATEAVNGTSGANGQNGNTNSGAGNGAVGERSGMTAAR